MSRRALGRAVALVLAGALGVAATVDMASAADQTVSVDTFLARIKDARALAEAGSADPSPEAMRRVRAALGLPVLVEVSGTRVRIEQDPYLADLEGSISDDFVRAATHLGSIAAEIREADTVAPPGGEAIDDAVGRALVGVGRPTAIDVARAYAYSAIVKVFRMLFEPLREFRGVRSVLSWAIVAALLVGIVWLLRRQGLGLVSDLATGRPREARDVDWDRVADDALRRGDLREATRALYHVLLRRLAFRGIVPPGISTTAGECRAAVAAKLPGAYDAVARGTSAFERVAYGGAPPSPQDVEALREAARRIAA